MAEINIQQDQFENNNKIVQKHFFKKKKKSKNVMLQMQRKIYRTCSIQIWQSQKFTTGKNKKKKKKQKKNREKTEKFNPQTSRAVLQFFNTRRKIAL